MTAIVLRDLGNRKESRAWFSTAARAAAESGDQQLHASVLAREAMVPLNYGAPKATAGLADQARQAAGTGLTADAVPAAAVAARAYALNHQAEQARAALKAADALMGRLSESERSDTWLTYSEQKHHVHLSHAFTTLADTRRARESQQRALELSASISTMTRTLLNIDAACSHHDGDSEQASRRTVAALTALPADYRTGPVRRPRRGPVRGDPRPAPPRTRCPGTTRRRGRLTAKASTAGGQARSRRSGSTGLRRRAYRPRRKRDGADHPAGLRRLGQGRSCGAPRVDHGRRRARAGTR
ncbi:hypothetical protein AB0B40_37350 [Streptomyces sp. NPDC042638]|uniref:hypothetical protein n=1 Tax=Streptomyces sp. NPDC042638 TaxID=3154333 RepID=UPI0033EAA3E5